MSAALNLAPQTEHPAITRHSATILPFRATADHEFFQELEMRYGCAFAQWLIDDIRKNGH